MSTTYREARNIEASTIQFIETILSENNWNNVSVEKTFARVYDVPMNPDTKNAIVCVRVGMTIHDGLEVGSNSTIRKPLILIDVFASSDGQRLDLVDTLISGLKNGFDYQEYIIEGGEIESGTVTNGRIQVLSIIDTPVNFDISKDQLDPHDRYRSLITLNCQKSLIEE